MRLATLIVAALAFLVLAIPAMAQPPEGGDVVCLHVQINPVGEYSIDNYFNDVVIDNCDDYAESYNLGYILYSVCTNMDWQLSGHWEPVCDDEPQMPFPEDWQIWQSDNGVDNWGMLTQDEEEQVLDEGACDEFVDRDWHFALTGPDICDEVGNYYGEIEFHLGAF